jgi:hypothetical protein
MLILGRARHNVAPVIAVATFVVIALSGVVVISGLTARVAKLEADLTTLRSDLDHPQPKPLASMALQPPR